MKPKEQGISKETDWSLRVLCQNDDGVCLKNPAIHRCISQANKIETAYKVCALPFDIELIERDNDGSGIVETLIKNKANCHADCHARDVSRDGKRKSKAEPSSSTLAPVKKKPRFSTEKLKDDSKLCLFKTMLWNPSCMEPLHSLLTTMFSPYLAGHESYWKVGWM